MNEGKGEGRFAISIRASAFEVRTVFGQPSGVHQMCGAPARSAGECTRDSQEKRGVALRSLREVKRWSDEFALDSDKCPESGQVYLFLHAQSKIPSYIGKVLLLSPIIGDFTNNDGLRMFSPPRSGILQKLVSEGTYKAPRRCEIHVGSDDWQSEPGSVGELADLLKIPVHIVESNGHMLDKAYVKNLLDQWLN